MPRAKTNTINDQYQPVVVATSTTASLRQSVLKNLNITNQFTFFFSLIIFTFSFLLIGLPQMQGIV